MLNNYCRRASYTTHHASQISTLDVDYRQVKYLNTTNIKMSDIKNAWCLRMAMASLQLVATKPKY